MELKLLDKLEYGIMNIKQNGIMNNSGKMKEIMNKGDPIIPLPPPIQFVEAAPRIPPTYTKLGTKEEALRRYAQEKIKREKLLKQRRVAENRIKHFINKMKIIEEELNRSDRELAILEPIVVADIFNPNGNKGGVIGAPDLQSRGPGFKLPFEPLAGVVLGSPKFNSSAAFLKANFSASSSICPADLLRLSQTLLHLCGFNKTLKKC